MFGRQCHLDVGADGRARGQTIGAAQRATAKFFARGVRSEQSGWSRGERPMTVGTASTREFARRLCPVLAVRPDGANVRVTAWVGAS